MSSFFHRAAFAAFLCLSLAASKAHAQAAPAAQPAPETNNLVDINPVSLIAGEISLEYERALSSGASLVIGPKVLAFNGVNAPAGTSVVGFGVDLGVHFFPFGEALHGFWVGPQVGVAYEHLTYRDVTGEGVGFGAYGVVGYTFFPAEHLPISIGVGAGYASAGATATDSNGNSASAAASGFAITGRLAIGYAW